MSTVNVGVSVPAIGTISGRAVVEGGVQFPEGEKPPPATNTRFTFVAIPATGQTVVRHLKADLEGRFQLDLPPGTYRIGETVLPGVPTARQGFVVVRSGQVAQVRLKMSVR